jgi:hypothetical protein
MMLSTVNLCNRIFEHECVSLNIKIVSYMSWVIELKSFRPLKF